MTTFSLTHEANNLNEYTAQTTTGGAAVTTSAASAMGGTNFGVQATISENEAAFTYLDFASFGGDQYSVSFWFDPNSITMPTVNPPDFSLPDLSMFRLRKGAALGALTTELQFDGTNYVIRCIIRDDNDVLQSTSTITISDAAQFFEMTVVKASTVTSNDGSLEVKIDDVVKDTISNLDLFNKFPDPSRIEIGINDSEPGMSGTCYWDQVTGLFGETLSTGSRPLEMDLDLEDGSKKWVTYWSGGSLNLREYSDNFTIQSTSVLATGTTAAEVTNRSFYISPYSPPFFGTPSLNDIVYVFGRWDDGGVIHLAKSTDGGSSFSDIGDSGTWGTGWLGGFFADDANILYAFVNGGSAALYRSIDAGSTWTSLSSLPFNVDPGGVSKHPDGRILIANRDTGAAMVAYAEPPDYPVWFDATGSPTFPTGGGGANAVIWIT